MGSKEKPSEWCQRMMREAKSGEDAMNYYKLAKMWESRGL